MEAELSGTHTDTRVIVTAGASGIGRAIAEGFAEAGARVHVCDIDLAALDSLIRANPRIGTTVADVSSPDQVDGLFDEAVEWLRGLDVLINNAGIAGPTAPVEDVTPEEWRRTMAVNIDGQFLCARRAVPFLKAAGGGTIVNIASTAGLMGYPLRAPYAASKWAVVGFTKTLAMELGPDGIRVNAICPGPVSGERMAKVAAAEAEAKGVSEGEVRAGYVKQVSMQKFIDAREIAEAVLFLAGPSGGSISGQALGVDGHTETLRT